MRGRVNARHLLFLFALCAGSSSACGQVDPLRETLRLTVDESVVEDGRPSIALSIATALEYPCANVRIDVRSRRARDTVAFTIVGLVDEIICLSAFAPAGVRVPMPVRPGRYVIAVTRGPVTDRMALTVTRARLVVRPLGTLAFIRPDTSEFLRPAAQSFLLTCGTSNVPELCTDLVDWVARQPGVVRRPLSDADRIGVPLYGGYGRTVNALFDYAGVRALAPVRRCMRLVADTLARSVGAGVTLQTAGGEVLRAWTRLSFDDPHLPVPLRISGAPRCP
jgi:hypothetical protein